jgi:hypothetical protein
MALLIQCSLKLTNETRISGKSQMKILVFAPFFPPDPTGSSVFAGQQVQELVQRGNEVYVITNQPDQNAPGMKLSMSQNRCLGQEQLQDFVAPALI